MQSALPNPLNAKRHDLASDSGIIALYSAGPAASRQPPALLIHSVNAAGSAFEVRPLFDMFARSRPVFAFDLPGFGNSDRSDRAYTVRLMTNAILAVVEEIERHTKQPIDAIALSLSCEFLARAAAEKPSSFSSLGLVSPTGFEGKARTEAGGTKGKTWLRKTLNCPLWSSAFWSLLTTRPVIRKFLEKAWGSKDIDEPLLNYDVQTMRQPGARYAPYYFVSGFLFSKDILNIYRALTLPVWMVHGVRGDFVDYHLKTYVEHLPNWKIDVLQTGAFPQFENLELVAKSFEELISKTGKEKPTFAG